jgi:hypothetical protein
MVKKISVGGLGRLSAPVSLFCVFAVFVAFAVLSCSQPPTQEQVAIDRIEYVYDLKPVVEKHWPGFSDRRLDIPLVYYTDSVCYAVNPTEELLAARPDALKVFDNSDIKIYRTALLDSVPFHMSVSMSLGDPDPAAPDYDYRSPLVLCSSFEITRTIVPGVESVGEWATMLMHEYFHGFQFRHPEFLNHYEQAALYLPPQDTLKRLYKNDERFRESIDRENDALLAALDALGATETPAKVKAEAGAEAGAEETLSTTDIREAAAQVATFFRLRDERRTLTQRQSGFDTTSLEQLYETMEGTARYVEWALSGELGLFDPATGMPEWLWRTDKTTWFYASGFNMARLLDKLGGRWRSRLFNEGSLSLEQILVEKTLKHEK